jgi:hypothetical protein
MNAIVWFTRGRMVVLGDLGSSLRCSEDQGWGTHDLRMPKRLCKQIKIVVFKACIPEIEYSCC